MGNHKDGFYVTKPARLVLFPVKLADFYMTHLKFIPYVTYIKVYERCENLSWPQIHAYAW